MREYELTVLYDLALAEADGADASSAHLTQAVESRGGTVLKVDHWGRRRLAYPIRNAIDADYVVTRVELDPAEVRGLEEAFRINEQVYRHLIVRAFDHLLVAETSCNYYWGSRWVHRSFDDLEQTYYLLDTAMKQLPKVSQPGEQTVT